MPEDTNMNSSSVQKLLYTISNWGIMRHNSF